MGPVGEVAPGAGSSVMASTTLPGGDAASVRSMPVPCEPTLPAYELCPAVAGSQRPPREART